MASSVIPQLAGTVNEAGTDPRRAAAAEQLGAVGANADQAAGTPAEQRLGAVGVNTNQAGGAPAEQRLGIVGQDAQDRERGVPVQLRSGAAINVEAAAAGLQAGLPGAVGIDAGHAAAGAPAEQRLGAVGINAGRRGAGVPLELRGGMFNNWEAAAAGLPTSAQVRAVGRRARRPAAE